MLNLLLLYLQTRKTHASGLVQDGAGLFHQQFSLVVVIHYKSLQGQMSNLLHYLLNMFVYSGQIEHNRLRDVNEVLLQSDTPGLRQPHLHRSVQI
jgi:hypothetical protein